MITAGVTAAVAAVLTAFGVKPGPYLVGVAVGVKLTLVAAALVVGGRLVRRPRRAEPPPAPPAE